MSLCQVLGEAEGSEVGGAEADREPGGGAAGLLIHGHSQEDLSHTPGIPHTRYPIRQVSHTPGIPHYRYPTLQKSQAHI